jgi:bilirubin oxidase
MNRPKGKTVPIWLSCEPTARRLQARFLLGPSPAPFSGTPLHFRDPVTENPALGSTEIWEIRNLTGEAHPIHIHQVQFEVVNRETRTGQVRAAEAWEQGVKDTVIVYPLETTRVKATFNRPGQFVWHCHMLEHEDNDMMRPYSVGPLQTPL